MVLSIKEKPKCQILFCLSFKKQQQKKPYWLTVMLDFFFHSNCLHWHFSDVESIHYGDTSSGSCGLQNVKHVCFIVYCHFRVVGTATFCNFQHLPSSKTSQTWLFCFVVTGQPIFPHKVFLFFETRPYLIQAQAGLGFQLILCLSFPGAGIAGRSLDISQLLNVFLLFFIFKGFTTTPIPQPQ